MTKTGTLWKSGCLGEDHGFDFEDIKLKMPIRHLRTDAEGMTVTGVWVQERGLDCQGRGLAKITLNKAISQHRCACYKE